MLDSLTNKICDLAERVASELLAEGAAELTPLKPTEPEDSA